MSPDTVPQFVPQAAESQKMSEPMRAYSVVGIHVAGASTPRTSLIRARLHSSAVYTGQHGILHDRLAPQWAQCFPGKTVLPGVSGAEQTDSHGRTDHSRQAALRPFTGPLLVEAVLSHLGPMPERGADQRLVEVITDLGPADFYVLDAPLSLPPCQTCELPCPGPERCTVDEVRRMQGLFDVQRKKGRKVRSPQPYLDRYFEYFARQVLEFGSAYAELDAALGSNRAPLAARGRFLLRNLRGLNPEGRVLETNAAVSSWAWRRSLLEAESPVLPRAAGSRYEQRVIRKALVEALVASGRVCPGPGLHRSALGELFQVPESFLALLAALTVRTMASGEVFLQEDLMFADQNIFEQPVLPRAAGLFIETAHEVSQESGPF